MTAPRLTNEHRTKGAVSRGLGRQIRTSSPTLRSIFEEMQRQEVLVKDMAARLKVHENLPSNWRRGATAPSILMVEEMAHKLGYRLVLEPIEKGKSK